MKVFLTMLEFQIVGLEVVGLPTVHRDPLMFEFLVIMSIIFLKINSKYSFSAHIARNLTLHAYHMHILKYPVIIKICSSG